MSDFTNAVVEVYMSGIQDQHPDGMTPAEILDEVWKTHPGQFQLCTVIDVCHEKDAVMAAVGEYRRLDVPAREGGKRL